MIKELFGDKQKLNLVPLIRKVVWLGDLEVDKFLESGRKHPTFQKIYIQAFCMWVATYNEQDVYIHIHIFYPKPKTNTVLNKYTMHVIISTQTVP
jgi:hypothetical protein